MSQLQATTTQLPAPAAQAEPLLLAGPGRSFWQVVGHAFFRPVLHRIAVTYVSILALIAVFVPFIANGRPYYAVVDGERRWPLFQTLTRVDLIVLIAGVAVMIYGIGHWWVRRRPDPEARARPRHYAMLILGVSAVLASLAIVTFRSSYNDLLRREDYKGITPDYEVKNAVFAPLSWGFDDSVYPRTVESLFQSPSRQHPLGTDGSGRDTLCRLLWSARIVFGIGLISEIIALTIGIIYGALMGYFVGTVDILGSRFIELVESVPTFFLIITIVAIFGRQISMIMVILGLTSWTGIARFIRAEFFKIRKLDYVQAAIATGLPLRRVLFRHMLPNGLTSVLVSATFGIAGVITLESGLSFLGLGVQPPTPSWGSMLNEAGNPAEIFHFWLALPPGFMIFLTIFAYNIIGEGARDAIDPRLNRVI